MSEDYESPAKEFDPHPIDDNKKVCVKSRRPSMDDVLEITEVEIKKRIWYNMRMVKEKGKNHFVHLCCSCRNIDHL